MTKKLRRAEAAKYLRDKHGIPSTTKSLANQATSGDGPPMRFWGRIPLYVPEELDKWVNDRLDESFGSTSQKRERAQ